MHKNLSLIYINFHKLKSLGCLTVEKPLKLEIKCFKIRNCLFQT